MRTSLYEIYAKYQGKVINFHGWELPVQFEGIIAEHLAVRNHVGLFDVSHMGEIYITGLDATNFLNYVLTNQISGLKPGMIRYTPLCNENGGTIDDLLVYCLADNNFLLVVNASNTDTDYQWLSNQTANFNVTLTNRSASIAQLALQGPAAASLISEFINPEVTKLKYYQFSETTNTILNTKILISRTGYTGEDGFELYLDSSYAVALWETLMKAGIPYGLVPIGLGARDTLRFEAGLPLHGNELSLEISPVMAGLHRFIAWDKENFIGKSALKAEFEHSSAYKLIGLELLDRGIPRSGYLVFKDGIEVGKVTSGSYCPFLEANLAMVLIKSQLCQPEVEVQLEIRGKLIPAKLCALPFYSRRKESPQK